MDTVKKVGAMILRDRTLLVVREHGSSHFMSVGGRPEQGETPLQTLEREVQEELGVRVSRETPLGTFRGVTLDGHPIEMVTFLAEVEGEPAPCSEIEELAWVGRDFEARGLLLAPLLRQQVIPSLVRKGLL